MKSEGREVKGLGEAENRRSSGTKSPVHLIYLVVGQLPVAQRPFGGRRQGILGASQNLSSFLCW